MGRDWSDDILIAKLRAEPQTRDELNAVTRLVLDRPTCDLVVDIGAVDEPGYETLAELTELRNLLSNCGRHCVFYNVSTAARRVFNLYGFDGILDIADMSEVVLTPSVQQHNTGILELRTSDSVRPPERRKYVRLHVPSPLIIDVLLWHGGRKDDYHKTLPGHFWRGRLVDVSEGGAQVAINAAEGAILAKGRLVGLEFAEYAILAVREQVHQGTAGAAPAIRGTDRPTPASPRKTIQRPSLSCAETLLEFDAQVREMLPSADGENTCIGLQFVALEANPEGRQCLQKLCGSEGILYQASRSTP